MINNENIVSELTLYPRWFKKKTSLCVSFSKVNAVQKKWLRY